MFLQVRVFGGVLAMSESLTGRDRRGSTYKPVSPVGSLDQSTSPDTDSPPGWGEPHPPPHQGAKAWRAMGGPQSPQQGVTTLPEVLQAGLTHSPSGTGAWPRVGVQLRLLQGSGHGGTSGIRAGGGGKHLGGRLEQGVRLRTCNGRRDLVSRTWHSLPGPCSPPEFR